MSHWRKFTNNVLKNTDMVIFERALSNLGYDVNHDIKRVQNAYGHANVDMALTKDGRVLSIGFRKDKETDDLVMECDTWLTGVNESTFMNQLAQQYNKENIVEKLKQTSQFSVTDIETNKKGEIEITVACL